MAKKIDTVIDNESGISAPIYLDTKTSEFSAEYADFSIRSKDGELVKKELLKAIRERATLKWIPITRVTQERTGTLHTSGGVIPPENRETMNLSFERFYVAIKADGSWVRTPWDMADYWRQSRAQPWYGDLPLGATEIKYYGGLEPNRFGYNRLDGKYILPYSEELWEGLCEVIRQMVRIRQMVSGILSNEQGIATLIQIGKEEQSGT